MIDALSNGMDLIARGGAVMYFLVLLSVYTLSLIIYKFSQMSALGIFEDARFKKVTELVEKKDEARLLMMAQNENNIIAQILKSVLHENKKSSVKKSEIEENLKSIAEENFIELESGIGSLQLIATLSPLAGLLGTVLGMVDAFSVIAQEGNKVEPSLLAGGIWEALLTTAAGLVIAIPAMVAYHYFSSQLDIFKVKLENLFNKIA